MIKQIKQYWIQKDKLQHCLLASYIQNMLLIVFLFILPLWGNILLSTVITLGICAFKEYLDYRNKEKGVANKHDFYAGLIGVIIIDIQWVIFFVLYKFFPIFV